MGIVGACATKRNEVLGGTPLGQYRQAMSPWGVASGGGQPEVQERPLQGPGEARGKPPSGQAGLRQGRVSTRRGKRPTGKMPLASLSCPMGQRPHPRVGRCPEDDRNWFGSLRSPKDVRGHPELPSARSGFRQERLGSEIGHRLNTAAASMRVNVGGPGVEGSSPPMQRTGVGGPRGVGARESRPPGEGGQLGGLSTQQSRM